MARKDPLRSYRFMIEFDSVQWGGFSRVKGIAAETKVESYREGGVNEYEHKLATMTSYGNLVLEHGLVDTKLWEWHRAVIEGRILRRTVSIILKNEANAEMRRWHLDARSEEHTS